MGDISIDVGELSKPATVLINKISNAVGILYEPRRIKQKAKAEVEAQETKVLGSLKIQDIIEQRALIRLVTEEVKNQENIESITSKALTSLDADAKPDEIEDDWLRNFFSKCKLISDDEMQTIWSKILAGEANNSGTFSKRTIEFLSMMDKSDAVLFDNFSKFCWYRCSKCSLPLIFDYSSDDNLYKKFDISYHTLNHLSMIGLINFENLGLEQSFNSDDKTLELNYYGRILILDIQDNKKLNVGFVSLMKVGSDLMSVLHPMISSDTLASQYYNEYYHSVVNNLYHQGIVLSEPLENKMKLKNI